MSRIANYLAGQALNIIAGRRAAAASPDPIQDADPVPAALTECHEPVFRTIRDGRASVHIPHLESIAPLWPGPSSSSQPHGESCD